MRTNFFEKCAYRSKEQGVTLLLSILVLSSITSVAFSLAAVTLIEVRTSGDVLRTEPVYYSDQGIAEEAVYLLKRKAAADATFGSDCSPVFKPYSTPPDPSVVTGTKICGISADKSLKVRIPPSATTYQSAKKFYLFNPGAAKNNQYPGPSNYGIINITNISQFNDSVQVYICRLDQECAAPGTYSWSVPGDVLVKGEKGEYGAGFIDGNNYSYEVSILNLSPALTPHDLFVQIDTFDINGVPQGLPYLNKKAVQIQSTRAGLTRRIEVQVPTQ